MNPQKLVITHDLDKELLEKVKEAAPDWEVIAGKDASVWEPHIEEAEIIAGWKKGLESHCLTEKAKLKWLQTWSAGVNSLPLSDLQSKNVAVTSANGVHSYPISETIFALMLGLTRKIHAYVRNQQEKKWHHANLSLEIHGKTIGILGTGAIGKETAKIAKAFGMKVIGLRNSGEPEDYFDEMYAMDGLSSLLPECDYVVVALPLTEKTHRLIGQEQLNKMKSTAYLINIGRGDIIDEKELIQALQDGKIAGAGLDVFEKEPLEENSPLWEMKNVIITPHTAGSTEHYNSRLIQEIFIPNLKDYIAGNDPQINLLDYSKGY
ncbi:D-2-hydroxyacid dehydrogenase [Falsibacillus pallidus]|uniref:Phosphoglycerate dehydrogenase-like enzyme n=1 Tax=Falsibacillus pallidus TaxID=493781 RepID=A0A370G432_9BACI|nr:D-2-hydroxyacid dehydrogenase [Falsibacillus pallidus]RDI38505.1 phosphoglycerate dehydrogenase-like enzyme [Falsibacillus pallidus]